jgi:hypothetical protein
MNKHIRNYLRSFKVNKAFLYTLIIDVVAILLILGIVLAFGKVLGDKAFALSDGKTAEQLKVELLSGTEEQALEFLAKAKSFVFVFFAGTVLTFLLLMMAFSFSRAFLWNKIKRSKLTRKNFWRWNGISLIILFLAGAYFLIFAIFRIAFNVIFPLVGNTIYFVFAKAVTLFFQLTFLLFVFLVFYSFVHKYKAWESVSDAFNLIKVHWNRIWRMFLLSLLTILLISLVLYPLGKAFFYRQNLMTIINVVVLVLFMSWQRIYMLKIVGPIKE